MMASSPKNNDAVVLAINDALSKNAGKYDRYGLRVVYDERGEFSVGDTLEPSYRWEDGEQTDQRLSGASCIDARDVERALRVSEDYFGNRLLVVGGNDVRYGQDPLELIVADAIVLAIIPIEQD